MACEPDFNEDQIMLASGDQSRNQATAAFAAENGALTASKGLEPSPLAASSIDRDGGAAEGAPLRGKPRPRVVETGFIEE